MAAEGREATTGHCCQKCTSTSRCSLPTTVLITHIWLGPFRPNQDSWLPGLVGWPGSSIAASCLCCRFVHFSLGPCMLSKQPRLMVPDPSLPLNVVFSLASGSALLLRAINEILFANDGRVLNLEAELTGFCPTGGLTAAGRITLSAVTHESPGQASPRFVRLAFKKLSREVSSNPAGSESLVVVGCSAPSV